MIAWDSNKINVCKTVWVILVRTKREEYGERLHGGRFVRYKPRWWRGRVLQ
jgi:hypothetical protein